VELQNKVSESVASRSDGGKEFHSLGAQAAKQLFKCIDIMTVLEIIVYGRNLSWSENLLYCTVEAKFEIGIYN